MAHSFENMNIKFGQSLYYEPAKVPFWTQRIQKITALNISLSGYNDNV